MAPHIAKILLANGEAIQLVSSPDALGSANESIFPAFDAIHHEETEATEEQLQRCWQDEMCRQMKIPTGYLNVAVLLVQWEDEIDELRCGSQVQELEAVFRDDFNFITEIVKLNGLSKAQHQLNRAIANFLEKRDGQHNLTIIYYTGHGLFDLEKEVLEIAAHSETKSATGSNLARANWNAAERTLLSDVECDVLTILDCCFASDIQMQTKKHQPDVKTIEENFRWNVGRDDKEDLPIYELLTASGPGLPTSSSAEHSLTGRLIKALKKLVTQKATFTTAELNQLMVTATENHGETIPCLFNRRDRQARHISLGQLVRSPKREDSFTSNPIRSYLTLKFALRTDELTETQVKHLARRLTNACKKPTEVEIRRIDWVSLRRPARPSGIKHTMAAIRGAKRWRAHTASRKQSEHRNANGWAGDEMTPASQALEVNFPQHKHAKQEHEQHQHRDRREVTVTPSKSFIVFDLVSKTLGIIALLLVVIALAVNYGM
ncbi:MAG: hypothetical protein M1820_005109 [Bogoriella megaspora]|nr:MAG: hypothetical protein M1820_005109 [Bogoriella megaspora]